MANDLAKSVDEVATNFQEKVDGMKKVVSSTVDQIQTMKLKMQELHLRGSTPEFVDTRRHHSAEVPANKKPTTSSQKSWPDNKGTKIH